MLQDLAWQNRVSPARPGFGETPVDLVITLLDRSGIGGGCQAVALSEGQAVLPPYDRWAWTSNAAHGMLEIWTGTATSPAVPKFNSAQRSNESTKRMYSAAAPYAHDTGGLPLE